jgi:hypothetical protein
MKRLLLFMTAFCSVWTVQVQAAEGDPSPGQLLP